MLGMNKLQANLILAQAKHETGNFTSDLFKKQNNAFGMGEPHARISTDLDINETGFAEYSSLELSVIDLILWYKATQFRWNLISTPSDYARELKFHNYYEDSIANYEKGLEYFYNKA